MRCGQTLADLPSDTAMPYDFHAGASDLMEADLHRYAHRIQAFIVALLSLLMVGGVLTLAAPSLWNQVPDFLSFTQIDEPMTPTVRPTLGLMTVTPGAATPTPSVTPPPTATATPTPTPEPCVRQVSPDDTLYGLAASCGHTSFDVLSLIVELNDLPDANSITSGQTLFIPWPTEIASATPEADESSASADGEASTQLIQAGTNEATVSAFDEEFDPFFVATATLRPGMQFHTVVAGETMIVIAQQYGATAEILSQLNPEISFESCDFGARYGGPRCVVTLIEGQQIRVPAPTPTPTLSPTPSGSETATPTTTPTFNAPALQTPRDRAFFRSNELVTLRWVPTGTLASDEVYRVHVEDMTEGIIFIADTRNTSYILPQAWQGTDDQRHEYRWFISIIKSDNPTDPSFVTESLSFTWEGRGESS
jgi:LysM repeat protein